MTTEKDSIYFDTKEEATSDMEYLHALGVDAYIKEVLPGKWTVVAGQEEGE